MSLRFYIGGSGSGKSRQIYKEVTTRSIAEPETNFLIIVPDQFTMQTQMDLVREHPRGGIMNIDVLSFARLAHRIFEEVGGNDAPVLDDTGKSLVLRKVAAGLKEELPFLGGNLKKLGYIHEVKSAISEFMQYGINAARMRELVAFCEKRGALHHKLKDLERLYGGFCAYIKEKYITSEELLSRLSGVLPKSHIIKNSVVILDGFTGFTPVQNQVIQQLMCLCAEVAVTVVMGREADLHAAAGEQQLFYLGYKTIHDLEKLAQEAGIGRGEDVVFKEAPVKRHADNPSLAHLEKELFRFPLKPYAGEHPAISLYEAHSPKSEAYYVCARIRRLVREEGCCYRDIAIVAGDMQMYAPYVEEACRRFAIPYYLDMTRRIALNPFVEYIRSALQIVLYNFSYETVFHLIRSGLVEIEQETADQLENYVLALGIRGKKRWGSLFTIHTRDMRHAAQTKEGGKEAKAQLAQLNEARQKLMDMLAPLLKKHKTAGDLVKALYAFIAQNQVQYKLQHFEKLFSREGDLAKAKEYSQIYRLIMELLEQVYALLGDEEMPLEEFLDILDAGFGEITVGTIPQNVDRVLVGDIERTRLQEIKTLFFIGINDGSIPKGTSKGGIISDIDREFLAGSGIELAPTPRQQMYIQRLYLYMNMTKPTDWLYLSYANVNNAGRALRKAYLVDTMQALFPHMQKQKEEEAAPCGLETPEEGIDYFAKKLCQYTQGRYLDGQLKEEEDAFLTLYYAYARQEAYKERVKELVDAAFCTYEPGSLGSSLAKLLYGQTLENSVSRLEQYAACAYAHFLKYGLLLEEREDFTFEDADMGMLFHSVLEEFPIRLKEEGWQWLDFPKEEGERLIDGILEAQAAAYKDTLLFDSARNAYAITRMQRILKRTVATLQYHLLQGKFTPKRFEVSFQQMSDLESVSVTLSEGEKMKLRGRIDRIDTGETQDGICVKVIDYKSGSHNFQLASFYYGLQMQLIVYLNAAMELEKKENPGREVIPAGVLYYHVADPYGKIDGETYAKMPALTDEEINVRIRRELCMTGAVNADEKIIRLFDGNFVDRSDVIPVICKKDGSFKENSQAYTGGELACILSYAKEKTRALGQKIMEGDIAHNPYEMGGKEACTYCPYRQICGFDEKLPGYGKRRLYEESQETVLQKIKEELQPAERK